MIDGTAPTPASERQDAKDARSPLLADRVHRARYLARRQATALLYSTLNVLWHALLDPLHPPPVEAILKGHAMLRELLERDLRNAERGFYPRDLIHESPTALTTFLAAAGPRELLRMFLRRRRGAFDEIPSGAKPQRYPAYYRRTFHWQTDGWLSERSARLYDAGVELLFLGVADVMRRMAIPPLVKSLGRRAEPRILDVGCGTGRLLAQLHRALPEAILYGVELSPFYAAHARRELPTDARASIVNENAEALPFAAESFDGAASTFLLHELPHDARRRVLRETRRVLKRGAHLVVVDALQPLAQEAAGLQYFFEAFPRLYHEPYFKSYTRDDLISLLAECGFAVVDADACYLSRRVAARRT